MLDKLRNALTGTNGRNKILVRNILFSAILKVIGLATSLIVVRVTLHYLNNEIYGIWMTITSIIYWISVFDIGMGNGMRNYMTMAISKNNYPEARAYLSTTLFALTVIALVAVVLMILPLSLLDFNSVFNTRVLPSDELRNAMVVAFAFTMMLFVMKNISYVFMAMQKYALADLLTVASNVAALAIVYVLTKTTQGNLLLVVLAFTAAPVVTYLLAAIPFFVSYPQLRPRFGEFRKDLLSKIVGKGLNFFFIQITSCLVIYGASNMFIIQFCGPESVTVYNIAYKFFNLMAIAYTVIISPMWNAYTDAYIKGDYAWIRSNFRTSLCSWLMIEVVGVVMLFLSHWFYRLWVGSAVSVPLSVSLSVFAFISLFNFNNAATYLINGLNKIRVQMITSIVVTALYLAAMLCFGHCIGIEGVVFSMAAAYLVMGAIHFYQCRLLITSRASGIWDK
jgi:putative LPS biosynthesis related polysaccharide transporter/flippase